MPGNRDNEEEQEQDIEDLQDKLGELLNENEEGDEQVDVER